MPLFSATELLLMIAGATSGIAGGYAIFDAYRARRRAERGECARCGQPWAAAYPDADRFLVQGREVCSPCATVLRKRLPILLRRLGWVGAIGVAWVAYEVGVRAALGGYFSLSHLGSALALPTLFGGATVSILAMAARRNRLALAEHRQ
jgi:hypothetical protein